MRAAWVALALIGCAAPRYHVSPATAQLIEQTPPGARDDLALASRRADGDKVVFVRGGALLLETPPWWSLRHRGLAEAIDPARPPQPVGPDRWEVKADNHPLTKAGRAFTVAALLFAVAGAAMAAPGSDCASSGSAICFDFRYHLGLGLMVAGSVLALIGLPMWIAGEVAFPREVPAGRRGFTFVGDPPAPLPRPPSRNAQPEPQQHGRADGP